MYDPQLLEALVRFDPAGRGLAMARDARGIPLCSGSLRYAAEHLAFHGHRVLIVTGFAVVLSDRVTAETDGPLGALFLAAMLQAAGLEIRLAADPCAFDILRAGCALAGLATTAVMEFPQSGNDPIAREEIAAWRRVHADTDAEYSHLIFIERAGPSHTGAGVVRSLGDSQREEVTSAFERLVPAVDRDVCHNMRGESIDSYTAPLHELVGPGGDLRPGSTRPRTIGIVDGGNEIGCGAIDWNLLRSVVAGDASARIACRVATDFTIPAGISNWGAYALGAAVVSLRSALRPEALRTLADWTAAKHQKLLAALVEAGAVDGVTKRAEATVDGIPLDVYLAQFERIKAAAV